MVAIGFASAPAWKVASFWTASAGSITTSIATLLLACILTLYHTLFLSVHLYKAEYREPSEPYDENKSVKARSGQSKQWQTHMQVKREELGSPQRRDMKTSQFAVLVPQLVIQNYQWPVGPKFTDNVSGSQQSCTRVGAGVNPWLGEKELGLNLAGSDRGLSAGPLGGVGHDAYSPKAPPRSPAAPSITCSAKEFMCTITGRADVLLDGPHGHHLSDGAGGHPHADMERVSSTRRGPRHAGMQSQSRSSRETSPPQNAVLRNGNSGPTMNLKSATEGLASKEIIIDWSDSGIAPNAGSQEARSIAGVRHSSVRQESSTGMTNGHALNRSYDSALADTWHNSSTDSGSDESEGSRPPMCIENIYVKELEGRW